MTIHRKSYRVTFTGGLGYELAGIIDRPDDDHRYPVVLFSHCFTCNKDLKAIVRISRELAAHKVIVVRYDMTGLGGSGGSFEETNFESNIADLFAAAKFARDEVGSPAVLLGHSLGGAASMAAASKWPSELSPLLGVATLAAPSDTSHLANLLVHMDRRVESEGRGEVTIGGRKWTTTTQLIQNLRDYELASRIATLTVPMLIFHSPQDETVGYDHAIRIMGLAREATSSLITLPGADHLLVNNDADIRYVARVLSAWIFRISESLMRADEGSKG